VADSTLSPADRSVRDRVRDVVDRHVAPAAADVDRRGTFPEAGYRALASAELAGLLVSPEYGGSGHSTVAYAAAMEEIAAACGSTSLVYMTQMHTAFPIEAFGTDHQKRRYLPRLCSGEIYGSIAITEPDGGSDVAVGLARGALAAGLAAARQAGLLDPAALSAQAIQAELAQLRTEVAAGRTLLLRTAALVDASAGTGGDRPRLTAEVAEAKLFCTDLGVSVADRVVDLLGGAGDLAGSAAERCLRDAKVTQIYDGTNQIQRVLIARDTHARLTA
jgi:alkylation response protein AidB-like acyl-CoA dehydrogenase